MHYTLNLLLLLSSLLAYVSSAPAPRHLSTSGQSRIHIPLPGDPDAEGRIHIPVPGTDTAPEGDGL